MEHEAAKQAKEIPQLDGHWLVGNLMEFKDAPHEFMARVAAQGHDLVQFRILNKKLIAVLDADYAEVIFKNHSQNYARGKQRKPLESLLGKGLINLEGEKWKSHRRMVAQGFKPDFLKTSLNHNSVLVTTLLDEWEEKSANNETIEIVEEMRRIALSVIVKGLFSVDLDLNENQRLYNAIANANKVLFKRFVSLVSAPDWIPTPLNRQLAEARKGMDWFTQEQLKIRQSEPDHNQGDVFAHFLALHEAGELSREDVFDEIRTLFVAGFETTAAAVAWTLYLIAKNPQVTERWYKELEAYLGGKPPTWDNIGKLKFTEQLFMEGLRLKPTVYMMSRVCQKDDVVNGYTVPAGSPMVLSLYAIHRSHKYWDNPDQFMPERFDKAWPEHAYFPFGLGKHICIGNRFSVLESTLILACIGQRFKLSLQNNEEVKDAARITLTPADEILVNLESR